MKFKIEDPKNEGTNGSPEGKDIMAAWAEEAVSGTQPVNEPEKPETSMPIDSEPKFKENDEIKIGDGLTIVVEEMSKHTTYAYAVTARLEGGESLETVVTESELEGLKNGKLVIDGVAKKGTLIELVPGVVVKMLPSGKECKIILNAPNGLILQEIKTGKNFFEDNRNAIKVLFNKDGLQATPEDVLSGNIETI